jgi:hypothetical protein
MNSSHKPNLHNVHWKCHLLFFLAGAAAFHTFGHIFFAFSGLLPMHIFSINLTQKLNLFTIIISSIITIGLLWWAFKTDHSAAIK